MYLKLQTREYYHFLVPHSLHKSVYVIAHISVWFIFIQTKLVTSRISTCVCFAKIGNGSVLGGTPRTSFIYLTRGQKYTVGTFMSFSIFISNIIRIIMFAEEWFNCCKDTFSSINLSSGFVLPFTHMGQKEKTFSDLYWEENLPCGYVMLHKLAVFSFAANHITFPSSARSNLNLVFPIKGIYIVK